MDFENSKIFQIWLTLLYRLVLYWADQLEILLPHKSYRMANGYVPYETTYLFSLLEYEAKGKTVLDIRSTIKGT